MVPPWRHKADTYWSIQQVASWCNIFMYSHATWNYWVTNPNLSLCSNEAFLPASCSVTPPGTGEKEMRGLKGGDGHKCSSSSPLPLSKAVFLWGFFHCYCPTVGAACSPPRVSAIWLRHELNLTPGARFDSHTHTLTGHAASPWPHYEKVSQSLRPKIDFSAFFAPSRGSRGHAMWGFGG